MTQDLHNPSSYGDAFADVYDSWYPSLGDEQACISAIARLARGQTVLELGIGTGRLAIPLAQLGVDVVGIDASEAMLTRLREKLGTTAVRVICGDMADVGVRGPFGVVFIAYNTFFNLPDRHSQLRCLSGIADVLAPNGTLAIEAFTPLERITSSGPTLTLRSRTTNQLILIASRHDPTNNVISGHHIEITSSGTTLRPWRVSYLNPSDLDDLANLAGLSLVTRDSDWDGGTYGSSSPTHVSYYTLAKI